MRSTCGVGSASPKGMKELDADPDVRVIIMRGATPEAFIAGADISEFPAMRANAEQARAYRDAPANAISAMLESPKPVVGMLSGVCIGGGLQVGLSCDIRIAARGTRFGVPAARLGLAYPLDGVTRSDQRGRSRQRTRHPALGAAVRYG